MIKKLSYQKHLYVKAWYYLVLLFPLLTNSQKLGSANAGVIRLGAHLWIRPSPRIYFSRLLLSTWASGYSKAQSTLVQFSLLCTGFQQWRINAQASDQPGTSQDMSLLLKRPLRGASCSCFNVVSIHLPCWFWMIFDECSKKCIL